MVTELIVYKYRNVLKALSRTVLNLAETLKKSCNNSKGKKMADSTVSFFLEKLTNLAIQEASLFGEFEGQITLLRNELPWMRLFLRQASMNRTSDERLRLWVDQMRDVCFDAEDVVDDFMFRVDHMRQQRLNNLKCLRPLLQCIGFGDKLLLVHDLKARMENINITVDLDINSREIRDGPIFEH